MIRDDSEKARWLQDPRFLLPLCPSRDRLPTCEKVFTGLPLASLNFTAHTGHLMLVLAEPVTI